MNRHLLLLFCICLLATPLAVAQAAPPAGFAISGTVVDFISGAALSGIQVGIAPAKDRSQYHTVVTAGNGRFVFDHLAPGKYDLFAEGDGYATQSLDQHGQYWTSVAVGPQSNSHDLIFRLVPFSSISGRVIDNMSEPVRDARVTLYEYTADPQANLPLVTARTTVTTNDLGIYHFGSLLPGKYAIAVEAKPWYAEEYESRRHKVVVRKPGNAGNDPEENEESGGVQPADAAPQTDEAADSVFDVAYPITYYPDTADPDRAEFIHLPPGAKIAADITLHALRAVHTRLAVQDASTTSLKLWQKGLGGTWIETGADRWSASHGFLEASGIAPGRYSAEMTFVSDEENAASEENAVVTKNFEFDPGENSNINTSGVPANLQLTGTYQLESGEIPSEGVSISLQERKTHQVLHAGSYSNGKFTLVRGCPPGSYDIAVEAQELLLRSVTATGAKVTGQMLDIKGPGAVNLSLVLTRGAGEVNGVALRGDKPLSGAMILLVPNDPAHNPSFFRRDQSDSDGSFTLSSVLPGKYTVLAMKDGWELDYRNPDVLKPYLAQGTPVQVEAKKKYEVKAKVQ